MRRWRRGSITPRPSLAAGRNVFTWTGPLTGTPNGDAPIDPQRVLHLQGRDRGPAGRRAKGCSSRRAAGSRGYGFYLLKGKPVFIWNLVDLKRVRWEGPEALTPGKHTLEFDFKYDGLGMGTLAFNSLSGIGRGGTGVLKVDGKVVATRRWSARCPFILAVGREPRRRLGHRHAGGRRRLPGAVRLHRQDRKDHALDRPAAAVAGGYPEAPARPTEQEDDRVRRLKENLWIDDR